MSEKKKIYKCEQCGEPCVIHIFNNGLDIDMPELCPVEKSCSPRWMEISDFYHNPPHETVEQWEKRTGETYPDDGPVYPADMFCGKPCYKDCRSYRDAKKQGWNITIVANHHGKPPKEKS
jgi:hypothetical protein